MNLPLKWHGGKRYLAGRIVGLFPPHIHYVEPFAGGMAVLLSRNPEGVSEVANDINRDLMNFWAVLQGGNSFEAFRRLCEATPFSEDMWRDADLEMQEWPEPCAMASDAVVRAWRFFLWCRFSLAGRMKAFTGITKTRTRRGMNNEVSAWLSCVEGLPQVHARLRRVLLVNRPALEVIRGQDGPETLFYVDPPYLHETRTSPGEYRHEMSEQDHRELLATLRDCKGKVILSGYPSELYDSTLNDWRVVDIEIPNHAAGGVSKRRMTEWLWLNYAASRESA